MPLESLAGPLITLGGKVLDFAIKDRPVLQIRPERLLSGANVYMYLSVNNPAKHSIHIIGIRASTGLFEIWKDSSANSAGDAADGIEPDFILESEESKFLPLLAVDRRPENEDLPSWITMRWRSLQRPSRWQIPVTLKLTHSDFDRIKSAR